MRQLENSKTEALNALQKFQSQLAAQRKIRAKELEERRNEAKYDTPRCPCLASSPLITCSLPLPPSCSPFLLSLCQQCSTNGRVAQAA